MARIAKIYAAYEKKLRSANALDFDDIIFHTVTLLRQEPEVLDYYQHKFRYVAGGRVPGHQPPAVSADISAGGGYKKPLRGGRRRPVHLPVPGANIENILNFEKQYPQCPDHPPGAELPLHPEHPDAANAVIRNNMGRRARTLWTDNGGGDVVTVKTNFNESDAANYVAGDILMGVAGAGTSGTARYSTG